MAISSRIASIENCVTSLQNPDLTSTWENAISISTDAQKYLESLPKTLNPAPGLQVFQNLTQEEQQVLLNFTKARSAAWLSFSAELLYALFPDFDAEVDAIVKGA